MESETKASVVSLFDRPEKRWSDLRGPAAAGTGLGAVNFGESDGEALDGGDMGHHQPYLEAINSGEKTAQNISSGIVVPTFHI